MNDSPLQRCVRKAAALYRPAGRAAEHFALGKLAGDPVFAALLDRRLIPEGARLVDLGCGRGLLGAWLRMAREDYEAQPESGLIESPPRIAKYQGIELMPADAQCAGMALGDWADIITGDMQTAEWAPADVIVMLDVLYFLEPAAQEQLLVRIHRHLDAKGVLLMRVADASGGAGFWWTQIVDYGVAWWRGHGFSRFHCRPLTEWKSLLERLGFFCEMRPMSAGTLFHNVLIVARPQLPES